MAATGVLPFVRGIDFTRNNFQVRSFCLFARNYWNLFTPHLSRSKPCLFIITGSFRIISNLSVLRSSCLASFTTVVVVGKIRGNVAICLTWKMRYFPSKINNKILNWSRSILVGKKVSSLFCFDLFTSKMFCWNYDNLFWCYFF